jgi:hypothetical protein
MYSPSPKAKRVEFRCPDPSCNPYLAFSAILMAAVDGIQNKINPGEPLDKDLYDLEPEERAEIPQAPGSLDEVLDALQRDHEYLLRGNVFTKDVIETWITYKGRRPNSYQPRPTAWGREINRARRANGPYYIGQIAFRAAATIFRSYDAPQLADDFQRVLDSCGGRCRLTRARCRPPAGQIR